MESVYIETSIPSYLTAKASRDLILVAHQELTILFSYDSFVEESRVVR
ncbi:MAG: hypothetical protein [Olavius algarvensis Gamma 1 endosymbiont]|nr:MAG: hypothetical protein [Olavius algarvensis Gamma 1 endosymbiont]